MASRLGDPGDQPTSISCRDKTSCLAVGNSSGTEGVEERLSDTGWRRSLVPVPAGAASIALNTVSCDRSDSHCVAVGTYRTSDQPGSPSHALVDVQTGATWTSTTDIDPSTGQVTPSAVSCPTTEDSCIGVGSIDEGNGVVKPVAIYAESRPPNRSA